MISKVEMERFTVISVKPFDDVIAAIKTAVGNPNMAEFGKAVQEAESAAELDAVVRRVLGRTGLMLFIEFDHGIVVMLEEISGTIAPRTSAGIWICCMHPAFKPVNSDSGKANNEAVYQQLRHVARNLLRNERPGHTLQATELVHEAFLKLITGNALQSVQEQSHVLALAIRAMRQVLVDHARAKYTAKRGNRQTKVDLSDAMSVVNNNAETYLVIDEIITELEELDSVKARIFEMRFILGLSREEVGTNLGIPVAQVKSALEFTRAWLRCKLAPKEAGD
jgi:RNA polymerase sigma-70 factor, ECF subfamily